MAENMGSSSYGEVYRGRDLQIGERVSSKMKSMDARHPCLYHEYTVYGAIPHTTGIPKVRWIGTGRGSSYGLSRPNPGRVI